MPEDKQDTVVFPVRTYPGSQWYFTDMPGMNSLTPPLSCWPFLITGGEGHGGTARRGESPCRVRQPLIVVLSQQQRGLSLNVSVLPSPAFQPSCFLSLLT